MIGTPAAASAWAILSGEAGRAALNGLDSVQSIVDCTRVLPQQLKDVTMRQLLRGERRQSFS